MKTIALALLLGLGMMVGCGSEPTKPAPKAAPSAAKTEKAPDAPATPVKPTDDKK